MVKTDDVATLSQQLADLRYQIGHEGDLLGEATTALRLCRQAIVPDHCAECRAAASLADEVLRHLAPEGAPQ